MPHEMICRNCLHIAPPKKVKQGSGKMEFFLWAALLVPGPFYSAWRMMSKKRACVACGSGSLAELDSPIGMKLKEIVDKEMADIEAGRPLAAKMPSLRKVDDKTLDAVKGAVAESIRQQTGMSVERGLGEMMDKEIQELEKATARVGNPQPSQRGESNPKPPQNPEDW